MMACVAASTRTEIFLILLLVVSTSSYFNSIIKIQNSKRSITVNGIPDSSRRNLPFTRLHAEKSASIDRSASICVSEFFSSSGKLPTPAVESRLSVIRKAGLDALSVAKLPFGKDEAWRYTNLKTLFLHPYATSAVTALVTEENIRCFIDESCANSCIVFVDGIMSETLSKTTSIPADVIACSINSLESKKFEELGIASMLEYVPDAGELPRNSYASDVITALNSANVVDIGVIQVSAGVHVDVPVQVLFVSTVGAVPSVSYPRLVVSVGDGASLQLKQSYASVKLDVSNDNEEDSEAAPEEVAGIDNVGEGGASLTVEVEDKKSVPTLVAANTRIVLGRNGSQLKHTYTQESAANNRHVEVLSVDVNQDSSYDVAALQMGGRISRLNVHVDLKESGSNCSVNGITLAQSRQSLDMHSSITHDAPSATSRQVQRNVIGDRGEAIFKGRIRIPQHAQLTDSDQICRSIMLGDRARIIAMPTLEITADNVVCSHGVSVADLDENSMFYLAARGIDRREARKLLLAGFMLELLEGYIMDAPSLKRMTKKVELMNPAIEAKETSGTYLSM